MKIGEKILLCCSLFLASCGGSINEHVLQDIDIDPTKVFDVSETVNSDPDYFFEDLISEIKIIQFETKEESIISEIYRAIFTDKYIYIMDVHKNIKIFDTNGKFVKKISKGQGPNEIAIPTSIFFDKGKQTFNVADQGNSKISIFSPDGQLIENKYHTTCVNDCVFDKDKILVYMEGAVFSDRNARIDIVDTLFKEESVWNLGTEPFNIGFPTNFQEIDNGFNIKRHLSNCLYSYKDGIVEKKYAFTDSRSKYNINQYKELINLRDELSRSEYLCTGKTLESKDYLYSEFYNNSMPINTQILINKNTGKQKKIKYQNFLAISVNIADVSDYENNWFWTTIPADWINGVQKANGIVNPNNLISDEDMEKLKNAKEDDNPLIALFKIKFE